LIIENHFVYLQNDETIFEEVEEVEEVV